MIVRRQASPTNVVLLGAVKKGYTSLPVLPGNNLIGNVYGANMTLASSGLYTGSFSTGFAGGTVSTSDQVIVWNGISYDTYYYQTVGTGGVGWRRSGNTVTDASATILPIGASFFINRRISPGFNWRIPQHPANL